MKTFIVSCVAVSMILVLSEASEYKGNYKKAVDECLKEQNLSNEDYLKMVEANDEKVACTFACANKKIEGFDGTKFNAEKIHEATEAEIANKKVEYTADMKAAMDKCIEAGNNSDGDECKKTDTFMKCIFEDKNLEKVMAKEDMKTMASDSMSEVTMALP